MIDINNSKQQKRAHSLVFIPLRWVHNDLKMCRKYWIRTPTCGINRQMYLVHFQGSHYFYYFHHSKLHVTLHTLSVLTSQKFHTLYVCCDLRSARPKIRVTCQPDIWTCLFAKCFKLCSLLTTISIMSDCKMRTYTLGAVLIKGRNWEPSVRICRTNRSLRTTSNWLSDHDNTDHIPKHVNSELTLYIWYASVHITRCSSSIFQMDYHLVSCGHSYYECTQINVLCYIWLEGVSDSLSPCLRLQTLENPSCMFWREDYSSSNTPQRDLTLAGAKWFYCHLHFRLAQFSWFIFWEIHILATYLASARRHGNVGRF